VSLANQDDDDDGPSIDKPLYSFDNIFNIGSQSIGVRWLDQQQQPQSNLLRSQSHHYHSHHPDPPSAGRALRKSRAVEGATVATPASFIYQDGSGNIVLQAITNNTTTFPSPASQKLLANYTALLSQVPTLSASYYAESPVVMQDATTGLQVPKTILLAQNYVKQWRHSFFARFQLLDVETQVLSALDPSSTSTSDMNPLWSPDGQFVVSNPLFFSTFSSIFLSTCLAIYC